MRSITVSRAASLLFYVSLVQSTSHHLFVGSFESNQIFALAYDNETNALTMEKPLTAHQASPVLAFNNNRTVLYAGEQDGWSSYNVQSPTALSFTKHIPIRGRCFGDVLKHGQTNLLVSKKPPFNVHGVGPSPCGVVMSVRADGSLDCVIQKTPYQNTSLVQSMAMDKEGKWMFSADQHANGIWTHRVDPNTGKLDRRSFTPMPLKYARPKKLVLHPAGNYLYVLLAEQSSVASFEIIYGQAGRPKLRCTSNVYSLLPNGKFV
jgi:carboxy-cis,cis-muconate cyclase